MSARRTVVLSILTISYTFTSAWTGLAGTPPETGDAAAIFSEARELSDADGGKLWGVTLYGPMLLVDRETRTAMANEADPEGLLRANGEVYTGLLPPDVPIANTAVTFGGKDWTMIMWPLPEDGFVRRALIAHELWHRVQDDVGLPSRDPGSTHLAEYDGRLWLELEWRALAAALQTSGTARDDAIRDALAFRTCRRSVFEHAGEAERQLELHEGLAEYTGFALSGRDAHANAAAAAKKLKNAEDSATFVRSFAYASGPAYGLLLDAADPGWRGRLTADDDLGDLLGAAIGGQVTRSLDENTKIASEKYDGSALVARERALDEERRAKLAAYQKRYVDGPVLRLDFERMNVEFDPGEVDALKNVGNIYGSMRVTDAWGILTVTGGGLITVDWRAAVVPAPAEGSGSVITGDGYTLELTPGWTLTPDAGGGYHLQKTAP